MDICQAGLYTGFCCFSELSGNVSPWKRGSKEGVLPQPSEEGWGQPGCGSWAEPSGQAIGLLEISGQGSTGYVGAGPGSGRLKERYQKDSC